MIAQRYPLKACDKPGNRERTIRNVLDSNGTLIIYHHRLSGGTEETLRCCIEFQRPYLLIDAREFSEAHAAERALEFVSQEKIRVLNVAGPRASDWADGYAYAKAVIARMCGAKG